MKLFFMTLTGLFLLCACGKDNGGPGPEGPQGPEGFKSLLDLMEVSPGEQCANGGIRILSGIDKNKNDKLDANEVDNQKYICNGVNGGPDKELIIRLGGVSTSAGQLSAKWLFIPQFNIANYPGVDSVVLLAQVYGYNGFGQPSTPVTTTLDVYNMTDNAPIANSTIVSQETTLGGFVSSANCRALFPNKPIGLGLRVSAKISTDYATCYNAFLILYRK